jgi:phosphoribosylglycinamide formyltransferase-1
MPMYKLGWFSTGRDKAARDLLTVVQGAMAQGEIEAAIAFVFCNREPDEAKESDLFLKLVKGYGTPLVCFSYQRFKASASIHPIDGGDGLPKWRLDYDREVMNRLQGFHPDLCVLAGYMLIVGAEMCHRYNMINLHPAPPGGPKGTWQEVIWQLIDSQAGKTGVMMHLVTPELDMGPPVTYCTFPIRGKPFDKYWHEIAGKTIGEIKKSEGENNRLFRLIRKHGLAREFPLIVSTLKAFGQGKIRISPEKQVVDAEGKPIKGYNLTDEIDKGLAREAKPPNILQGV